MIRPDAELHGKISFREWASLFSGKYFAMIVVYADETGTGGIPKSGKEPAPGVCGYLATPEMWEQFRILWQSTLEKNEADYFHFRELDKSERLKDGTHYFGWDDFEVDDFIYDMAFTVSCCPIIPFGGNAAVKMVHGDNPTPRDLDETYHRTFSTFFVDFGLQMNQHFPNEKEKVTFFFSDIDNESWISILNRRIKSAQKADKRIAEYAFIDPKSGRGIRKVFDCACQCCRKLNFIFHAPKLTQKGLVSQGYNYPN
jgi:hypothetical protein